MSIESDPVANIVFLLKYLVLIDLSLLIKMTV